MGIAGAGHGDRADVVFQSIVGFDRNRCTGLFLHEIRAEAAALNHEAGDDAVKNRVVVMTAGHMVEKVGDGFRGELCVEFEGDFVALR